MPAATTATLDPRVKQLSDGSPSGTVMGTSTTDLLGFYGNATPVAQPSSPAQAAVPITGTPAGAGALITYTSTQSPSLIATITVAEQSLTVTGVVATDFVIINKPTSQAGIGVCSGRASAANQIKLVLANATAGNLTPTSSEAYLVTTIPANLQLSAALTPASVAANTIAEQSFTVTGVAPGMIVAVNKPTTQAGLGVLSARVTANNTVAITFINPTAATLTPTAAETYLVAALNGLVASSQLINFGMNVGTLALCATVSSAEQSVTIAGIQAADILVGITKPTQQVGLGLCSGRVSGANAVSVSFVNPSAGNLTPTGSEVYGVTVFRPSPASPMSVLTTASLAPASVAANTSAEQTFTVTGIVSGLPVVVSPNYNLSSSGSVGIAGVRASATNTIAVTFINTTTAAIVPAAGTWTVAQFNHAIPTAGNFVSQLVSPVQTLGMSLLNALRAAKVSLGLIAGS